MPDLTDQVFFDYITASEVQDVVEHEEKVFEPDELDTPEQFRYRFEHAPHLFLGAFVPSPSASGKAAGRRLIGHMCASESPLTYYTKESMSVHVPFSRSICIHSVCLLDSHRGKRLGQRMMQEYLSRVQQYYSTDEALSKGRPDRVLLITHDDVRPFYEKAGFICRGRSNVVLGKGVWYEMMLEIKAK